MDEPNRCTGVLYRLNITIMRKIFGLLVLSLLSISTFALVYRTLTQRQISSDYALKFSTRSTDGTFSGLSGTVVFEPSDLANAKFDVSVDAKTIDTGMKKKDEHARGSDWLDADNFPAIRFVSSSFEKSGENYNVSGTLSMHGTSKQVTIPFQYTDGIFSGTFTVNRTDFGINGSGMKASFVGDEIEITFRVPTSEKNG